MRSRLMVALSLLLACATLVSWGGGIPVGAQAAAPPEVFRVSEEPGNAKLAQKPQYLRHRFVDVAFPLLVDKAKERVTLNLFANASFTATRDSLERDTDGSYEWSGHVDGVEDSEVLLVVD